MSLYKYFGPSAALPARPPPQSSLTKRDIESANSAVKGELPSAKTSKRGKYKDYTPESRAQIGKHAAENGPTKAARKFEVPEPTARRFKLEYQVRMKELSKSYNRPDLAPAVTSMPIKKQGRPLLLGVEIDEAVQDYIKALRSCGGVVNTVIVMAAAEGIMRVRDPGRLSEHGGHLQIKTSWAKSLMIRMGYVKRKASNAGKVSVAQFQELQENFLADISTEMVMNDIPPELTLNWDQTALHYLSTGEWTMNLSGEKIVPIACSDDKREITAVLAVSMSGQCVKDVLMNMTYVEWFRV